MSVPRSAVPSLEPGRYVAAVEKWFVDGAVRVDRLAFGGIHENGAILTTQEAEMLLQTALKDGRATTTAADTARLVTLATSLTETALQERFDRFVEEEAARHEDRVATGLARIERQRTTKARDLQERIDNWKYSGDPKKLKLIPAQLGKLNKLLAALNARREALERDRDRFAYQQDLVGLAVIAVGESR
jgi:hypothetical protein